MLPDAVIILKNYHYYMLFYLNQPSWLLYSLLSHFTLWPSSSVSSYSVTTLELQFFSIHNRRLFSFYFPYLGEITHISIFQFYLASVLLVCFYHWTRIFDFPSLPNPGIEPTTTSCVFWTIWCWNSWALNLMSVAMCKASGSSCQCLTLAFSVIFSSIDLLSWLNPTKAANYTFPSI